jgi:hypothetical protein
MWYNLSNMKDVVETRWDLPDVDPTTQSVMAAFSGRIPASFTDSMLEAFPRLSREDVVKTLGYSGAYGIRNLVVNALSGTDPDTVTSTINQIGELAGGPESAGVLAEQVSRTLTSGSGQYEAIPGLCVLSELAVANTVPLPETQ